MKKWQRIYFATFFAMNGKERITMKKVAELIKKSNKAVILPHINADGDAIGSSMAMREMLSYLGISAEIYTEEPVEERLGFIADGIKTYEGEVCDFDLCIVLDCGDADRLGKRFEIMEKAQRTVCLDHHRTNTGFGDAFVIIPEASATGEIMFDLCNELGVTMTRDLARFVYAAILSDTGGFAYSNTTVKTFSIASELVKYDINHAEVARLMFDTVDMNSELIKAELTKEIKSFCDGKIRTVSATREICEKFGVDVEEIEGLVDIPRRIRGTEIAVAIKEHEDHVRVSLRSNEYADVSKIATEFGGGGHMRAAGCTIYKSLSEALEDIVKACEGAI